MLIAVLAILAIAVALWAGWRAVALLGGLMRWWVVRSYQHAESEIEGPEAVRAYAAWVRNMPPPPPRPRAGPAIKVPPVVPPVRGVVAPYPGRRMAGG
jgi:hypothetical protein